MVEITRAGRVSLMVPRDAWYSFFNSPYPAHRACTAVDVYFSGEALFPCEEGVVADIRFLDAPRNRVDAVGREPVIIVSLGGGLALKVLHVKPLVSPGEKLVAGDPLGRVVVSGYLYPWSHPHAHFEVRPARQPYRVKGAVRLDLSPALRRAGPPPGVLQPLYAVVEVEQCYAWLKPLGAAGFAGLALWGWWVDGGMPHYGYGALLGGSQPIRGPLEALSQQPAPGVVLVKPLFEARVGGQRVAGLASYLNQPLLKVVKPPPSLSAGDVVEVALEPRGERGAGAGGRATAGGVL